MNSIIEGGEGLVLPLFYNPHPILILPYLQGYRVIYDDQENFSKKTPRSNSTLNSSQGSFDLIIPIYSEKEAIPYSKTRIYNSEKWAKDHWRFLVSNYGKAPYFIFLQDLLQDIYEQKFEFIFEFNFAILKFCLKVLRIDNKTDLLSDVSKQENSFLFTDINMLQLEISRVSEKWPGTWPVYPQLFGSTFAGGMGILDLVMCQGPDGKSFLMDLSEQIGDFQRFCGKNY